MNESDRFADAHAEVTPSRETYAPLMSLSTAVRAFVRVRIPGTSNIHTAGSVRSSFGPCGLTGETPCAHVHLDVHCRGVQQVFGRRGPNTSSRDHRSSRVRRGGRTDSSRPTRGRCGVEPRVPASPRKAFALRGRLSQVLAAALARGDRCRARLRRVDT